MEAVFAREFGSGVRDSRAGGGFLAVAQSELSAHLNDGTDFAEPCNFAEFCNIYAISHT